MRIFHLFYLYANNKMLPRTLVFAGGGTRCLIYLPALASLQSAGRLSAVKTVWGTSAGALIASLFALSHDAQSIQKTLYSTDFSHTRDIDINNILNINSSWGVDDGTKLRALISKLCDTMKPGASLYKLSDISGVNIVVTDLSVRQTIILNSVSYPNVLLVDAIRASMSLPFFLRPFITSEGHIWIDGGLRENFPWKLLASDEERRNALGFIMNGRSSMSPTSLLEYVFSMVHFDEPRNREAFRKWPNIIWFESPPYPTWFTRLQKEDYEMLTSRSLEALAHFSLAPPPETAENLLPSADHCTPSQDYLAGRTVESSDIPVPYHVPVQGSSPPQSPCTRLSYRRWSV